MSVWVGVPTSEDTQPAAAGGVKGGAGSYSLLVTVTPLLVTVTPLLVTLTPLLVTVTPLLVSVTPQCDCDTAM